MHRLFFPILLLTCSLDLSAQPTAGPSQKEVANQGWERLFFTTDRQPVSISIESEYGQAILSSFEAVLTKTQPVGLKLAGEIRAFKNWAIFRGCTANAEGKAALPAGGITSDTTVLFLFTKRGWTVVDYGLGHSDMFFVEWPAQYGMPEELLEPGKAR